MSLLFRVLIALALLGMCVRARVLQTRGVSDADKKEILDTHNAYRRGVSPTATNMRKMYWNDDLERSAQTWADKCIDHHDDDMARRRSANIGAQVGQNMATDPSDPWAKIIKLWYDEARFFDYDTHASNFTGEIPESIGHYTQVVWHESSLVGCALAKCGTMQYYFCNYAYGNMDGEKIYKKGTSCADCQAKCDDKLCDCNGKICKYGGELNLNTCSCTCKNGFTGDSCEICPWDDTHHSCYTDKELPTDCPRYISTPNRCPVMCEFCPDACPGKNINTCKNYGTLKKDCTCLCDPLYTGETCETVINCADGWKCGTDEPHAYTVADCTAYANVPKECPIMCGKCKN